MRQLHVASHSPAHILCRFECGGKRAKINPNTPGCSSFMKREWNNKFARGKQTTKKRQEGRWGQDGRELAALNLLCGLFRCLTDPKTVREL